MKKYYVNNKRVSKKAFENALIKANENIKIQFSELEKSAKKHDYIGIDIFSMQF